MKRFHSLDAMRAILMLIGVYFHLAHAYAPFNTGWTRNPETVSMFFAFFISTSNYFRMHAFFLIAGFFGALLYERKGARVMIINRFKRIFLPLIVPPSISTRVTIVASKSGINPSRAKDPKLNGIPATAV